jgi:hypothetical protein
MKKRYKVGDKVFAANNAYWGRRVMTISRLLGDGRVLAYHPKIGTEGGFETYELVPFSSERERALLKLEVLEEVVKEVEAKLFQ